MLKKKDTPAKNTIVMSNNSPKKIFLPQCDGVALDFIKITAAIFMVIDHMNHIWFDYKYFSMIMIGRGTFPLFCYAMAMAILKAKTDMPLHYIKRLLILALVTQPFYYFSVSTEIGSVICTLALGSLLAVLMSRLKLWQIYLIYIPFIFGALWNFPVEFGLPGVALPSAFVLALRGHKSAYPFMLLFLLLMNPAGQYDILGGEYPGPNVLVYYGLLGLACIILPWLVIDLARNFRQAGRLLPKYALHVFYPAHLFILKITGMLFFKG